MSRFFYTIFLCLLSFSTLAQKSQRLKVTGKITDELRKPLRGVTVLEMGTNNSTTTNAQGNYTLYVGYARATLVVTLDNYVKIEHDINAQLTQNFQMEDAARLFVGPIVGTHTLNRSVSEAPGSVDIVNIQELLSVNGQMDLNQLLSLAVPSFNANRQSGAGGSDFSDPSSVRGLGTDQFLVLINGKRRHQSAQINLSGSRGRGNAGTDLNAIPAAGVERIEILKDGAAAQYGSDAIGGVINVILKETVDQLTANANAGIYLANYRRDSRKFDGLTYQGNANYGLKIGQKGFINATIDYNFRDHTNRANTVDSLGIVRRKFGDSRIENGSFYYNGKFPVAANFQVYSFGGVNKRNAGAFSRSRLRDDDRNIISVYPNGFDPHITGKIDDIGLTVGIRGVWRSWDVDLSQTYGYNKFHFSVDHTLNRSFGATSPLEFDAGGFRQSQQVSNLNFTRSFKNILNGFNLAFGGEYRLENYRIFAGENLSWRNYDPEIVGGAQGFSGFSLDNVVDRNRWNAGGYLEGQLALTKQLFLDGAGRYENYSDFGSAITWKGGLRFRLDEKLVIRASVGTGFRAPSISQKYFSHTVHELVRGNAVEVQLVRNESDVTKALRVPELKQETSEQANVGFVFTPLKDLKIAVDGYYIKVKDRIILTGQFSADDATVGKLLKDLYVAQARFFTNGLSSTTTMGVDASVTYGLTLGPGKLNAALRANFNYMELGQPTTSSRLSGKDTVYLNRRERYFMLASAPPSKVNLTLDYTIGKFGVMARVTRFGEVRLLNSNLGMPNPITGRPYLSAAYTDVYPANFQADVTLRYKFSDNITLAIGGTNILNTYPDLQAPSVTDSGGAWDAVQMGSNGAFFFTRLGFKF